MRTIQILLAVGFLFLTNCKTSEKKVVDEVPSEKDILSRLKCPPHTEQMGDLPPASYRFACVNKSNRWEGPYVKWHESGKVAYYGFKFDGKSDGKVFTWYPDGVLGSIMNFKNGMQSGESKFFSEKGKLQNHRKWNAGKYGSIAIDYYETGKKKFEGEILNNMKVGSWTYFEQDSNKSKKCDFGSGALNIEKGDCQYIAEQIEPKGVHPPLVTVSKKNSKVYLLSLLSTQLKLMLPDGWSRDRENEVLTRSSFLAVKSGFDFEKSPAIFYISHEFNREKDFKSIVKEQESRIAKPVKSSEGKLKSGKTPYKMNQYQYDRFSKYEGGFSVKTGERFETAIYLNVSKDLTFILVISSENKEHYESNKGIMATVLDSLIVENK